MRASPARTPRCTSDPHRSGERGHHAGRWRRLAHPALRGGSMSKAIIRLGPRHKKLLYAGFALLWLSGALWLAFHYFFRIEGEFGPKPHPLEAWWLHPLEAWWLRLHGLMAM